jgi:hypothetical protein
VHETILETGSIDVANGGKVLERIRRLLLVNDCAAEHGGSPEDGGRRTVPQRCTYARSGLNCERECNGFRIGKRVVVAY